MGRRAPETIVKIKVAKGGVQIVAPEQADDPPAQPNAFRITRWPVYRLLGLGKLVDLLGLLLAVGCRALLCRLGVVALGESSRGKDRSRCAQCGRYAEHTMEHGSLGSSGPFLMMKRAFPG